MCRVLLCGCSEGFHTVFLCLTLAGGAMIDTTPTTPQVTTPQALLVKEEAAFFALLLCFSTSSALLTFEPSGPVVAHYYALLLC